jgi:hypothetical protein
MLGFMCGMEERGSNLRGSTCIMGFILIIAQDVNVRRFCVDNLVIRGHLAIGMARIVDECQELLASQVPEFLLMCGEPEQLERDLKGFRSLHQLSFVPIVVISRDRPSAEWMRQWHIAAQIPSFPDARHLVDLLRPWLFPDESANIAPVN